MAEQKQINQLKTDIGLLPEFDEEAVSDAESIWNKNINELKKMIIHNDPREFIKWDVVRETMFVGNADYINVELKYLQSHKQWDTRWKIAIQESHNGCPEPFYRYLKSSGNLIHHAYHLARFEDKTGLMVNELDNILEFGGGYGSMCRLAHNLGFKGKYVIYDFPHFSNLQKFYLNSLGLTLRTDDQFHLNNGIYCLNNLNDLIAVDPREKKSLFIATWSISESPLFIRERMLSQIVLYDAQLIAFQECFGEIDNLSFFKQRLEFNSCKNTYIENITHLTGNPSYYLFNWNS